MDKVVVDKEMIKAALAEALEESDFYIDRETHYKQHQWISDLIKWTDSIKSSAIRTVVQAVVLGFLALLVLGFAMKYEGH